jgi:hypothetical protein
MAILDFNDYSRTAAASDKVYQLLALGRWFSPDNPASSTTKTGRHVIAEILLKIYHFTSMVGGWVDGCVKVRISDLKCKY